MLRPTRITALALLAPTILLGIAACGTSKTPASLAAAAVKSPSTPVDLTSYGREYLAIMAPPTAALYALPGEALTAANAAPAISAILKAENQLLRVTWPSPVITADVKAEVTALGAVVGDLDAVGTLSASSEGAWNTQCAADVGKGNAAVAIVRADLGLPPTVTGTSP